MEWDLVVVVEGCAVVVERWDVLVVVCVVVVLVGWVLSVVGVVGVVV